MIDYKKLKLAMELVDKVNYGFSYHRNKSFEGNPVDKFCLHHYGEEEQFNDIDELISKLQELTAPESKYKVGDEVWFIDCTVRDGPITCGIVESIEAIARQFNEQCNFIKIEHCKIPEDCCYSSREALINEQISYWEKLKIEGLVECPYCKGIVQIDYHDCGGNIPFEGEIKGFKTRII